MAETTPVILPPLGQALITSLARKGLTALSAILVTHGVLSNADTAAFVQAGIGIAIGVASVGWTVYQAYLNKKRLEVATQPGVVNAATTNSQKPAVPLDVMVKAQ